MIEERKTGSGVDWVRNFATGEKQVVKWDVSIEDWGVVYTLGCELDAYKFAYNRRKSPNGLCLEHTPGSSRWFVTIWNEHAAKMGCDV